MTLPTKVTKEALLAKITVEDFGVIAVDTMTV